GDLSARGGLAKAMWRWPSGRKLKPESGLRHTGPAPLSCIRTPIAASSRPADSKYMGGARMAHIGLLPPMAIRPVLGAPRDWRRPTAARRERPLSSVSPLSQLLPSTSLV